MIGDALFFISGSIVLIAMGMEIQIWRDRRRRGGRIR
jgi:hypothetical protein